MNDGWECYLEAITTWSESWATGDVSQASTSSTRVSASRVHPKWQIIGTTWELAVCWVGWVCWLGWLQRPAPLWACRWSTTPVCVCASSVCRERSTRMHSPSSGSRASTCSAGPLCARRDWAHHTATERTTSRAPSCATSSSLHNTDTRIYKYRQNQSDAHGRMERYNAYSVSHIQSTTLNSNHLVILFFESKQFWVLV